MAYEKREGDIAIFEQRDKKSDRGPDWKGEALIDGKTYEIALWHKGGKGTMLAGQIKPSREKPASGGGDDFRGSSNRSVSGRFGDVEDDIPFVTAWTVR